MEPEQEQRLETKEEEEEGRLRTEQENKEECVEKKMNSREDEEERDKEELKRLNSVEDEWDTSSDSGGEREESTEVKTGMMAPCRPNGGQRLAFSPIRSLAQNNYDHNHCL